MDILRTLECRFRKLACRSPIGGPHWRQSVNDEIYIALGRVIKKATKSTNGGSCKLCNIPNELLDMIFGPLRPETNTLLRQTCTDMRYYDRYHASMDELDPFYRRLMRDSLDRDSIKTLIFIERSGIFNGRLFVCSFCRTVHKPSAFQAIDRAEIPETRVCLASQWNIRVCPTTIVSHEDLRAHLLEFLQSHGKGRVPSQPRLRSLRPVIDVSDLAALFAVFRSSRQELAIQCPSGDCLCTDSNGVGQTLSSRLYIDKDVGLKIESWFEVLQVPNTTVIRKARIVATLESCTNSILGGTLCPHVRFGQDAKQIAKGFKKSAPHARMKAKEGR